MLRGVVDNKQANKALTTQEAASLLGVGPSSIKRWADDGRLPSMKTPGGHRRFRQADIEALRDELESDGSSNSDREPAPLYKRIPQMTRQQIDALPLGVVRVDDQGFIKLYNRAESGFSGVPVHEAEGQHFFGELAPCTKNRIVFGRFKDGVRSGQLDFRLLYTFTYRMRPTNVQLHLYRDPETKTNWIFVDPVNPV